MKRNYFSAIVVLVVMVFTAFTSKAASLSEKDAAVVTEKQVSVQYTGILDNSIVFRVTFENPTAQKFNLIIKNDAGEILYNGQFSDTNFSKAVHLLKEQNEMNPVFIIRSGSQKVEQAFKVSVDDSLEDEVVVTKQ